MYKTTNKNEEKFKTIFKRLSYYLSKIIKQTQFGSLVYGGTSCKYYNAKAPFGSTKPT